MGDPTDTLPSALPPRIGPRVTSTSGIGNATRLAVLVSLVAASLALAPPAGAEDFRYDNRLVRIARIGLNDGTTDGAAGDGDGVAECGETIRLQLTFAISNFRPHLTLDDPTITVDARSRVATLVGNDASTLPDGFTRDETAVAPDRFTIQIDDVVDPGEAIYLVVDIRSSNEDTFRRHRHIPVMCDVDGDIDVGADGDPYDNEYPIPQITMPVYGSPSFSDNWLADRPALIHEGVDIFDPQMTPVLAARDGVVSGVLWTNDLAHVGPTLCCSVSIIHGDGWESWYSHLNNDTPGTDNDLGDVNALAWELGYVPGLQVGDVVQAGDLIGWMGDSGNAKGTPDHIHFELHDPAGNPVNPYVRLLQAARPGDPYACSSGEGMCRVAGADRYKTAVEASKRAPGSGVVYVAIGTNFPDAIAAGPAAAHENAPILLVLRDKLPASTLRELERLDPDLVVIVGGTGAVSTSVMNQIAAAVPGATLDRRWGSHRYHTAVAISEAAFAAPVDTLYVATGEAFPDALIAAPGAVANDAPLLLVRPNGLHGSVRTEIRRLDPNTIIIVGGDAAVPLLVEQELQALAPTVRRIGGSNRHSLSTNFSADQWPGGSATAYVARSDLYPDALSAGPLTRVSNGPLLLVDSGAAPSVVLNELDRLDPQRVIILGGTGAVSAEVATVLGAYLR